MPQALALGKCQQPLTPRSHSLPRSLYTNQIGDEGAKAIGEALKQNSGLAKLEYAAHPHLILHSHRPLPACPPSPAVSATADTPNPAVPRSLGANWIGAEGAKAVAEVLTENKTLGTLQCAPLCSPTPAPAPSARLLPMCQQPLTAPLRAR